MEGIQTLKGSWPWPSIGPYGISSCISHRPLPIYQISFKLKKLFVDGRTDVRTDGRTYGRTDGRTDISPLYIIRSTLGSRPKNDIEGGLHTDCLIPGLWPFLWFISRLTTCRLLWLGMWCRSWSWRLGFLHVDINNQQDIQQLHSTRHQSSS